MKRVYQKRRTARFRQWTRKGYAAFSSLGLCVTIGQLRKNVTERALTKQNGWGLTESTDYTEGERRTDETVPDSLPPLHEELLCAMLCTQTQTTSTPPAHPLIIHHINCGIDALNAFCNSLSPRREGKGKTHSVRQCLYSPYSSCV